MRCFLPFRGEFGFIVMMHAPQVHAAEGQKIVCCEVGNEALYPSASQFFFVDRRPDVERREHLEYDFMARTNVAVARRYGKDLEFILPNPQAPRKYFVPQPRTEQSIGPCDVVICPRKREYGPDKNWPKWSHLADQLHHRDFRVFAAGVAESSFDVPCSQAWRFNHPLDATIQAMTGAAVVIATDSGLAHLAVLCGAPLLLISHGDGLVAPGTDDVGRPYWPIKIERYERENHTGSPIHILRDAWTSDPSVIVDTVVEGLEFL